MSGLVVVAALYWGWIPPSIDGQILWAKGPDKRWILALYTLAIGLAYCPVVTKRLTDCWQDRPTLPALTSRPAISILNVIGMITVALMISGAGAASQVGVLTFPNLNPHELVHLGPIQGIHGGRVPYVEAQSMYGMGYQILSFGFMKAFSFSVFGFRVSHLFFNFLADSLRFFVLLIALRWRLGLAAVALCFVFTPSWVTHAFGWGVLLRWLGPIMVGALLPLILWGVTGDRRRLSQIAFLGVGVGSLAWFSQENFSTSLVAVALILIVAFARQRLTLTQAVTFGAVFAVFLVAAYLLLVAATVGPGHVVDAVALNFHGVGVRLQGVESTPWSSPESPWTIAFYATPYLIITILVCALYSRPDEDERKIGQLIGAAAAAGALVPLTLLRSDQWHFLGPMSTALPMLIVATIFLFPRALPGIGKRGRDAVFVAVALLLAAIFAAPIVAETRSMLTSLKYRTWSITRWAAPPATTFEHRLGFSLDPDTAVLVLFGADHAKYSTLRRLKSTVEGISRVVGTKSVLIENTPWRKAIGVPWQASLLYFLGNFKVGTSTPEPLISQWLPSDIDHQRDEVNRIPPECLITKGRSGQYLDEWLTKFRDHHDMTNLDLLTIRCKTP